MFAFTSTNNNNGAIRFWAFVSLLLASVQGFSTGSGTCIATMEAIAPMCEGMSRCQPNLDLQAELTVYPRDDGGADIHITGSRRNIRGVLIYAESNAGERVGTFDIGESAGVIGPNLQYMDCDDNPGATVTHSRNLRARGNTGIFLHWNRPVHSPGDVTFRAAIACHRNHYAIAPHKDSHVIDPDHPPVTTTDEEEITYEDVEEDEENVEITAPTDPEDEEAAVIIVAPPTPGADSVLPTPFNWAFVVASFGFAFISLCAVLLAHTSIRTSKIGRALLFDRPLGAMAKSHHVYLFLYCTTIALFLAVYNMADWEPNHRVRALTWAVTFTIASTPLPISRRSLWGALFGTDYDARAVFMRKYLMFLAAGLSAVLTLLVWSTPYDNFWGYNADGTAPFLVFTSAGALGLMCLLGRTSIQTRQYEVFHLSHHLMPALWVVWGLYFDNVYHRVLLAIPFALYAVDSGVRVMARFKPHFIVSAESSAGAMKLVLETNGMVFAAGQHVYLNCPSLNTFEWHCFNIASAPGAKELTLLLKDMGEGTWSNELQKHFKTNPDAKICIDGPYGAVPVRMSTYKAAVLMSGGIGVARNFSIAADLLKFAEEHKKLPGNLERVDFVWVTQKPDAFSWMPELLFALQNNPLFRVQLYCTRLGLGSGKFSGSMRSRPENPSRPEVADLFDDMLTLAAEYEDNGAMEADLAVQGSQSLKLLHKQESKRRGSNGSQGSNDSAGSDLEVGLMIKPEAIGANDMCVLASAPAQLAKELQLHCAKHGMDYNLESFVV